MSPDILDWITKLGIGGAFALMWWFERTDKMEERQERKRLQAVLESFLPVIEQNLRVNRVLRRALTADSVEDETP